MTVSAGAVIRVRRVRLHLLPVTTRVPLKFGGETLTGVTCARASVLVEDGGGRIAEGWGETPLSVQWVWPSVRPYSEREAALVALVRDIGAAWASLNESGDALALGADFQKHRLPGVLADLNARPERAGAPVPWLAALVCCSVFDQALHDAFGRVLDRPTYELYGPDYLGRDLAAFLEPAAAGVDFRGLYPEHFFRPSRMERLPAWHLVGGLDPLEDSDRTGDEPDDGYPVTLLDWIRRDGLRCLKVKLRGNDRDWDWERLVRVGGIAAANGVDWLTADFNCTVGDPDYVTGILDELRDSHPGIYARLLYVEQPFAYDLEANRIDVHSVSARKPLFLDESAHDWRMIRLGRELGWTGVALKTCKTQTGALLSAAWAAAHGMTLMVQDLTNPMLAQVPHVLLAAHVPTIMGVETNAMQFYPEASLAEARVHPGLYTRRAGVVDLSTVRGSGFGYRADEIRRELPEPVLDVGS